MSQAAIKIPSCRFYGDNDRCNSPIDRSSSYFCATHKTNFDGLANRDLLEKAAHSLRATYYVTHDKRVEQTTEPRLLGAVDMLMCELQARGYRPGEVVGAITEVQDNLGLNDDLDLAVGRDPKWRKFEKVTAGVQKFTEMGATVIHDDRIRGKNSKRLRQIDVSVRFKQGLSDYLLIVECKLAKRKVSLEKIESLITKMRDVGADRAIMVTNHGYQVGAIETARAHNIDLRTLTEQVHDWTSVVKSEVRSFPFFAGAEFDHDPLEAPLTQQRWSPVTYEAIKFLRIAEQKPLITLADLVKNIALQIYEKGERLPAEVTVPFEPSWHMIFPNVTHSIEVRGVRLSFEPYLVKSERRLDIPPRLSHYTYASVVQPERREIPATAVPHGLNTVLEAGRYYQIDRGGYYKCLEIKDKDVLWLQMIPRQDEKGQAYHGEFIQDVEYACYYLPVTDRTELIHLESLYARLLEYERLHEA
jgi:hypothetical protein